MIKDKDLREFRPTVRYQNGNGVTLQTVQEAIKQAAMNFGIPVSFYADQVKSGGLLNSSTEDCLVLFHPEHQNDYFKFCIRVKRQGAYAFVYINDFGQSKQMNKDARADAYREDRRGQSLSYKMGSMIGQAVTTIGKSKAKLEEEQNYYQCIFDIFDEIVS